MTYYVKLTFVKPNPNEGRINMTDWTAERKNTFTDKFGPAIEGCWNSGEFKVVALAPADCCMCRGGWSLRVKIVIGGSPDNAATIEANWPPDLRGEPAIPSAANTAESDFDELDVYLWPTELGQRQITVCHEFGHMIGLFHPIGSDGTRDYKN